MTGQVEALLVHRGARVWGKLDPTTHELAFGEHSCPDVDELVNLAVSRMLLRRMTVLELNRQQMPVGDPLAAIYFCPLATRA